jgi:hypothetical protein
MYATLKQSFPTYSKRANFDSKEGEMALGLGQLKIEQK